MASAIARYLVDFGAQEPDRFEPEEIIRPLEPQVVVAAEDPTERIREAEARGREEGYAAARAELEEVLRRERALFEERMAAARREWVASEAERLSGTWTTALQELEDKLAESVARVLLPFLAGELRKQAVEEFAEVLATVLSDRANAAVRVEGPQDLLEQIRERFASSSSRSIAWVGSDHADVRLVMGDTVAQTEFTGWRDRLVAAVGGDRS